MKDIVGNDLNLNDTVVFMQIGYRNLLVGKIIKITEKTVLIEHAATNTYSTQTKQFSSQVVKVMIP